MSNLQQSDNFSKNSVSLSCVTTTAGLMSEHLPRVGSQKILMLFWCGVAKRGLVWCTAS